ncbi:TIGR03643 family protein [Pleionea litopenaei]|uniref:TIGR03643 family protein n=1 Tax=Pleionea litopenaei TaxID=3070815 RepID=A0AA51RSR2_9GAMM|nr:TIGR03643 family protein [Pleionea sp. HL-JVS1]WMS86818.1 TIGR03643 family protein [Pleionea sp. HL-JVS1]
MTHPIENKRNNNGVSTLSPEDLSRIIEMAWEDRTPFEAIESLYGLDESAVIQLMRKEMKASSFKMWRKRVSGRKTKHKALRSPDVSRGYCSTQYKRQ